MHRVFAIKIKNGVTHYNAITQARPRFATPFWVTPFWVTPFLWQFYLPVSLLVKISMLFMISLKEIGSP
jgi:hypothetical protein